MCTVWTNNWSGITGLDSIAKTASCFSYLVFFHSLFTQWCVSVIEQTGSIDCLYKTLWQKQQFICLRDGTYQADAKQLAPTKVAHIRFPLDQTELIIDFSIISSDLIIRTYYRFLKIKMLLKFCSNKCSFGKHKST